MIREGVIIYVLEVEDVWYMKFEIIYILFFMSYVIY